MLFTIEDDDDLFLYEEDDFDEKAIIVAFGENEMIEALIIVLSLILILSRSLKLFFFFCVYFFSLLCFKVCLCGLLIWFSVVFYINPEKERKQKKTKKEALFSRNSLVF